MPPPPTGPPYVPPLDRCKVEDQSKCWEPWGEVHNENNAWGIWREMFPHTLTLSDGKLTFSKENYQNMLVCYFPANRWPLLSEFGQHLWFDARAVSTTGDLHFHYIVYHIYLRYWVQERILEPLVSRGDHWGPIPMPMHNDALKTVWDYGLGPGAFDVYELWRWAQEDAGQSIDPLDWHVWYVTIALEESEQSGFMEIVSDYVHLTYDIAPLPPPPSPVIYWLIITKVDVWSDTGKTIWITTDVPCHLTLRWQEKGPVWHDRLTVRRGVEDWRDPHLGFDDWQPIEQEELGDTELHSFILDPWIYPDEIWYYFTGTILGIPSSSRSPFYHQVKDLSDFKLLFFEAWGFVWTQPPTMEQLFKETWTP